MSVELTPSDVVGAAQRGLSELNVYLQGPAMAIEVGACKAHLGRVIALLETLEDMQAEIRAANDSGGTTQSKTG